MPHKTNILVSAMLAIALPALSSDKQEVIDNQQQLLKERYNISPHANKENALVYLPMGIKWETLSTMTPDKIRKGKLLPLGFLPLPHPIHNEGGMVFPPKHIKEIFKQEGRQLERYDVSFDLPDHLMPKYPPAMYLTTRPDLGDVSQGKVITNANYYDIFKDILNAKQLEGLRLLTTPFPQQQFNHTDDRRTVDPSRGVSCFDCHVNGHTNAAFHLLGDVRPQEFRPRIDTPSLRGVNIQRLFGSKRALKTIEDFTEFEQRAAYFDGDIMLAAKKGINVLDRASQVHPMAEFQEILAFPPNKLDIFGKLDKAIATPNEVAGEIIFNTKARCAECHPAPFYTDNLMHDLKEQRFFNTVTVGDHTAVGHGLNKTSTLRGIKESPPYLHDGRLLTLSDAVEYFNLILQVNLTQQEKADLLVFLKCL